MKYNSGNKNNDFMKFTGKWMEVENIILCEATKITKEHTLYVLTDKWILGKKLAIPMIQLIDHMKLKKEDQSVDASVLRWGNKILTEEIWRQSMEQRLKERAPGDWTTNQRVHMEGPMVLATYVAEDGLVGHHWEKRPLGLRVFNAPV